MSWAYINYEFPFPQIFNKELLWTDKNCNVYFAFKLNDTDEWNFFAGSETHALVTPGNILTAYGLSETAAQTNYLTTSKDTNGKILAVLPMNFQAKYARVYIQTGSNVSLYEWHPSTYITAHDIIAGELLITDKLSDAPVIRVEKTDVTRLKMGSFDGYYGIVGYDSSSNKIFELSDYQQMLGGWKFDNTKIYNETEGLTIDASLKAIYSNDYVSGPLGSGWRIDSEKAEFQNIIARGILRCTVFEKDTLSVINGLSLIGKGDVLVADMTATGTTFTIKGDTTFVVNEVLRIKDGVDDEWLVVTNVSSAPTYTVERDKASSYPTNKPIWKVGTAVVSMAVATKGFILMDASSTVSPVFQIFKRNSVTYNDYSEVLRLGNLEGFLSCPSGAYGIAVGDGSQYLKYYPGLGLEVKGTITGSVITGTSISGGTIIGSIFKTAEIGQRIEIDSEGISLIMGGDAFMYGAGYYWDGSYDWGPTTLAYINNTAKKVPFYINAESDYADFHFYNRASDAVYGEIGDMIVVNGVPKICVAATPTWYSCVLKTDAGYVGIGTSSPLQILDLVSGATAQVRVQSSQAAPWAGICGYTSRGTPTSPSATQSGDILFKVAGMGYGATGWAASTRGSMIINAAENWTDTAHGSYIKFETVSIGSIVSTERVRITDAGVLSVISGDITVANAKGIGAGANSQIIYDGTSSAAYIRFDSGGSERMRIDNAGAIRFHAYTTNGLLYLTSSNGTLSHLAHSTAGYVLTMNSGATAPEWQGTGKCVAWCHFNGTGTPAIQADYYVSTLSDMGTGDYRINFDGNMVDTKYATCSDGNTSYPENVAYARLNAWSPSGTAEDQTYISFAAFR